MTALSDLGSLLRFHIVLIAMTATVVFGWLMHGELALGAALVAGLDWMVINLLNRATDIDEDLANGIPATGLVARHRRAFEWGTLGALAVSFPLLWLWAPVLLPLRLAVQAIGVAYSYRLVPTPSGWKRFKELYFFKNFMSAGLFVFTCFGYPLALYGAPTGLPGGWGAAVLLMVFFVAFELTYEILYDLRDLDGDRAAGVPTYPVVHGPERARQIIDGLLGGSALVLAAGLALGLLGLREGLMLAAPAVQLAFYRPRVRRGLRRADCIWLTHLGTALLLFYLAGNVLWLQAGLPANFTL